MSEQFLRRHKKLRNGASDLPGEVDPSSLVLVKFQVGNDLSSPRILAVEKRRAVRKVYALAGNRTRVSRVGGENSTTEPPMPHLLYFLTALGKESPKRLRHPRWGNMLPPLFLKDRAQTDRHSRQRPAKKGYNQATA